VTGRGTSAPGFRLSVLVFGAIKPAFFERILDSSQYAVEIPQHVGVPNSDDPEPVRFQPRRPPRISLFILGMLAAIDFDDQSMLQTAEIDNVVADEMLSSKLRAIEALGAEILPEKAFGLRLLATQATYIGTQLVGCSHDIELYRRVWMLMTEAEQKQNPELRSLSGPSQFMLAAIA